MFLDAHHGRFGEKMKFYLNTVTYPVQYLVNLPRNLFESAGLLLQSQQQLREDNHALWTESMQLHVQQQRFLDLEDENRQLRLLLHAATALPMRIKMAEVLSVASGASASQWMINQGRQAGVFMGQAVFDQQGILGHVIEVGRNSSRVMLLNDRESGIPVESIHTGLRSVLQGNGVNHPLTLLFIPKTEPILLGDELVSSGMDQRLPHGYPVGKIATTVTPAGDSFMTVTVTPAARLERQRFVLLMWNTHA